MTALPIWYATGAAFGGTGAGAPDYPSGWLPGDFLLMVVETSNEAVTTPSGWTIFPDIPQGTGTGGGTVATRLSAYYRRATDADTPTASITDPGEHIFAQILGFRGVLETGDPWNVTSGGTDAVSDTNVSIAGDTTTVDNCLVVVACARSSDISTPEFASFTNSDLSNFTERSDDGTTAGNGGGVGVAVGGKATAGSYGTTTATLTTAAVKAFVTIALKPALGPWIVGLGTYLTNSGALSLGWPTGHDTDDIGLAFLESCNQAFTPPAGWAEVTNSPQGTGTAGTDPATRLSVQWKRATSNAEASPNFGDSGDHNTGFIMAVRNCASSGNPWDITSGGVKAVASTSTSIAGVTTTQSNDLLIYAVARDDDLATAHYSSWADASLTTGPWEIIDQGTGLSNGGGMGVAYGTLAAAGASGTMTATNSVSCVEGFMAIALKTTAGAAPASTVGRNFAVIIG